MQVLNVHDFIVSELRPLLGLLNVCVIDTGLGLDPGLAHVELLPASGRLHHGGVDTQLVPGAQDGHLHVPVARPPQLGHRLTQLGVSSTGVNHLGPDHQRRADLQLVAVTVCGVALKLSHLSSCLGLLKPAQGGAEQGQGLACPGGGLQ